MTVNKTLPKIHMMAEPVLMNTTNCSNATALLNTMVHINSNNSSETNDLSGLTKLESQGATSMASAPAAVLTFSMHRTGVAFGHGS